MKTTYSVIQHLTQHNMLQKLFDSVSEAAILLVILSTTPLEYKPHSYYFISIGHVLN